MTPNDDDNALVDVSYIDDDDDLDDAPDEDVFDPEGILTGTGGPAPEALPVGGSLEEMMVRSMMDQPDGDLQAMFEREMRREFARAQQDMSFKDRFLSRVMMRTMGVGAKKKPGRIRRFFMRIVDKILGVVGNVLGGRARRKGGAADAPSPEELAELERLFGNFQ